MMTIDTSNDKGNVTIKLAGRLDSTTAASFDETIKTVFSDNLSSLTVDMAETDFISSKGLRILVAAYKMMNGKNMTLQNPNASILEVLRMSGMLKIFTIRQD